MMPMYFLTRTFIKRNNYKAYRFLTGKRIYLKCRYLVNTHSWCICTHTLRYVPLLIPAYPTLHTTTEQQNFNYHQSQAHMVVENAFGRLKVRWRCLLKHLDMQCRWIMQQLQLEHTLYSITFANGLVITVWKSGNKLIRMKMMLYQCNMIADLDKLHQAYIMLLRTI